MFKKIITANIIMLAIGTAAMADTFTINGDTTGLATWTRVFGNPANPTLSGVGSNVPYQTVEVTVTDPVSFVAETTATHDTYLHLYSEVFDPLDQFTNLIALDDDGGVGLLSRIDHNNDGPIPEGQYVIVVSGFSNSNFGQFALFLDGVLLGFGPSTELQINELQASLLQAGRQTVRVLNANVQAAIAESIASRNITSLSSAATSADLAQDVYVWSKASIAYTDNNDHSLRSPMLQFGADIAISPNSILGISIGYGDLKQVSGTTTIEGSQVTFQPYLGWQTGSWQGSASVTFGQIDYDTITSASGTASAKGDLFALSADASHRILLENGSTVSPFASFSVGRVNLTDIKGSLAGADLAKAVLFQDVRFGARLTQQFGSSGVMTFGVSADYYHSNAPINLISGQFNSTGWSGTAEYGYQIELSNGMNVNATLVAGGLGSSSKYYLGSLEVGIEF